MDEGLSRAEFLNEDGHGWSDDNIRERCIEDVESEFAVAGLLADLKANLPFAQFETAKTIINCHIDALAYARVEKELL
jgi:hypothetical protein